MNDRMTALDDRMTRMEVSFATLSATLGTKIDALTAMVASSHADHEARVRTLEVRAQPDPTHEARISALEKAVDESHGERIGRLEKALYLAMGGAIVLGGSAGSIMSAVLG